MQSKSESFELTSTRGYQAAPQGRDDQYSQQSLTRQEGTNSTRGVYQTGYGKLQTPFSPFPYLAGLF